MGNIHEDCEKLRTNKLFQMINMQTEQHSLGQQVLNIQNITDEQSTIANREQSNTRTINKQNEISEQPCNKSVVLQDEQFCLSHGHQSDKPQSKVSNNSNSVRNYQCENSKSNCNTVEGTSQGQPIRRCKTKTTLPMCLGNLPLIELPSSNMQKIKQSKLPNNKKVYSKRYRHGYYAKRQINTQSQRGITNITDRIPLDAVSEIPKHQGNHQTSLHSAHLTNFRRRRLNHRPHPNHPPYSNLRSDQNYRSHQNHRPHQNFQSYQNFQPNHQPQQNQKDWLNYLEFVHGMTRKRT